jgi:hypothetical protein
MTEETNSFKEVMMRNSVSVDQKQINRWNAYKEILPEVERMSRDQLRELLDAIPAEMGDLRKALANRMP